MVTDANTAKREYAIEVDHLTVSYNAAPALLDVSLKIAPGTITGVLGPNGSGKSTLLKALLGFVKPDVGEIRFFGKPAQSAKGSVAYVPQRGVIDWEFPVTVAEVALMGRYGHAPWYRELSRDDHHKAAEALETVKMAEFKSRQIGQLSGGQQRRVFLARAMAQARRFCCSTNPSRASMPRPSGRCSKSWVGCARRGGRS